MANIKTRQSLAAKQALTVFVVSMLLGIVFSLKYTIVNLNNEQARLAEHYRLMLMQNYNTASQAVYQLNPVLAEQIAANLMVDPAIKSVRLKDDFGDILITQERTSFDSHYLNQWLAKYIAPKTTVFVTPLHQPGSKTVVGELSFQIQASKVAGNFIASHCKLLLFDLLRTCLLTIILLAFFYFKLSRPIMQLTSWVQELNHTQTPVPDSLLKGNNELKQLATTFYSLWVEREDATEQLNHLAYYDSLTQLYNRSMLMKVLNNAIETNLKNDTKGALFYLNLNRFKTINDSLGHTIGDKLIIAVGHRLGEWAHYNYTLARIGGDEFAVLLPAYDQHKVDDIVNDLLGYLSASYAIDDHKLYCTATIGISLFPDDSARSNIDVLRQADTALFRAKSSRQPYRFYLPEMQSQIATFMDIEKGLHDAIKLNQLELYYQPQVNKDNRIIGAEALVRWNHPTRGMLPPGVFMPVAEETGQIIDIGNWILRTACFQYAQWRDEGLLPDSFNRLAVNISPLQFAQDAFVELVQTALSDANIMGENIELEITENLLLENVDIARDKMCQLKDCGLYFSIDDFGTGYSSLRYLKYLDIDGLKIDRSFITNLHASSSAQAIVDTMIIIAKRLDIDVIAEGVENQDELDTLVSMQCEHFQGYFFDKPLPEKQLRERLQR